MGEDAVSAAPHSANVPASAPAPRGGGVKGAACRWVGLFLVLAPMLTRATMPTSTLPGWELDPTLFSISTPTMGPGGSMLVDALTLIGAALLLVSESVRGRRVGLLWVIGAGVGSAIVVLHGWWWQAIGSAAPHGTLGNQRVGIAWAAAVWSLVAVTHAARDPLVRRAVLGVLLAFVVVLALRAAQQVLIEHPVTVAAFNADRERWLASRGWTEDSPMARAYIRRMNQPEATGWFGLSNVTASFGAFALAAGAAWVWTLLRRGERGERSGVTLAGAVSALVGGAATVYLADSKGGYAAAGLGLGLVALGLAADRLRIIRRLGSLVGPLCIVGVLAAVAARGAIGERLGELSILFRWFYMQASARIFAAHPWTGVGPDGYQLAYLAAKNPLNPEEITSPHSVLLDWLSTLGVAGLAWGAVLIAASVLLGRGLVGSAGSERAPDAGEARRGTRAGMLTLAGATIAAAWMESPYITPDTAALRVLALAVGCLVVHAALAAGNERWTRIAACSGALAMLAHAQVELTASNVAACGLFMAAIGSGAAGGMADPVPRRTTPAILGAAVCAALAGLTLIAGARPAWAWQVDLGRAASTLRPVAEVSERAHALSLPPGARPPDEPREDPAHLLRDVERLIGRPVAPGPDGWQRAMVALDQAFLPRAAELLGAAQARYPDEWRVGRETGRLYLRLLLAAGTDAPLRAELRTKALAAIPACVPPADPERAARNPSRLRAQALVYETLSETTGEADLATAVDLLERAAKLDPYNLDVAVKIARFDRRLGRGPEAARWARHALELDGWTRLDRETRGLSPRARAEMEAIANGRDGGSPESGRIGTP